MRAVVQRVARARVVVDGREVSSIGPGLVALLGVRVGDDAAAAAWMADKIANLRIFPDDEGRMNRSVLEAGGAAIVVSQFTLYGDARKGRRPSFVDAARPEGAAPLVDDVVRRLREAGLDVGEGVFGAHMDVEITNDGPVTIVVDSP